MPSSDKLVNLVQQLEEACVRLAVEQRAGIVAAVTGAAPDAAAAAADAVVPEAPTVPEAAPQAVPDGAPPAVPEAGSPAPVPPSPVAPPVVVPPVVPPSWEVPAGPQPTASGEGVAPPAGPVPDVPVAPTPVVPAPAAPAVPAGAPGSAAAAALEEVRARIAAERDRLNQQWLRTLGRAALAVWTVAYLVVLVVVWRSRSGGGPPPDALALFWSATLLYAVIVGGAVALRRSGGLRHFLIGGDGRFSTSQTQAAVWTLVLVFAVTFLLLQAVSTGADVGEKVQLDDAYLLLLGFPFAALVAARGLTATKVESQTLQKVPAGQAQIRDLFTDDDGRGALIDVQFLLFNLVAIVYFVAKFVADHSALPKLPSGLVALTGVSALAYASSKAVAANAPRITAVTLSGTGAGDVRPGSLVDLRGANFVPPGAGRVEDLANVRVRFGAVEVYAAAKDGTGRALVTSEQVTVPVPPGVSGAVDVVVVTASGAESPPYRLLVSEDRPVVTGVDGVPLAVGARLTVTGRGFVAAGGSGTASVLFGGIPVQAAVTTPTSLVVTVPPTVAGQVTVPVVVRAAGGTSPSDTLALPVAATVATVALPAASGAPSVVLPGAGVTTG